MNRKLALVFWLVALLAIACRTDSTSSKPDAGGQKLGGVYPQKVGDFWVNETATTPFAIKDTGGVTRDTFETAHGRIAAGGGGSDARATLGPMPSFETGDVGLWLLTNGGPSMTASSSNVDVYSDGVSFYLNRPVASASYPINFSWAGGAGVFRFLYDGVNTATLTNQTSANIASFVLGTNNVGATLKLQADVASTVATFSKASSTSSLVVFSSPGLATAASINANDNGAAYFGAGSLNANYILFNGATNSYVVSSGGQHVFADNAARTYATIANSGTSIGVTAGANQITGALALTTVSIAANRTLDTTTTDNIVFVDTSGGVVSVTLPTPTNGRWLTIIDQKNTFGTNACTLVRHGTEKIDNVAASKTLNANGYRGNLLSNGTDWFSMNVSGTKPAAISGVLLALGLLIARRRRADNDLDVLKEAA